MLVLLASAQALHAQSEDARQLFQSGIEDFQAERYAEARDKFIRAYEASQRPNILVNLGSAHRQLGELLEARRAYERFLEESDDASISRRVERELVEVESLVPQLSIHVENRAPNDVVQVDGTPIENLEEPMEINPGWREVQVVRGGRVVQSVRVRVEPEGREEVSLTAPDVTDPAHVAQQGGDDRDPDPDDRVVGPGPVKRSPAGLIIGIALGVVVVAVGIVLAVVLGGGSNPYQGNIPPGSVRVP